MWLLECAAESAHPPVREGAFERIAVLLPRALKKRGREGEHDPERLTSLAVELLPSSPAAGDDLVFSLLKYGLSPDTEFALDLLVPLLGDKRGRILDLARHHSKFKEAVSRKRGLRLLLACLDGVEEVEDGVEVRRRGAKRRAEKARLRDIDVHLRNFRTFIRTQRLC